MALDHTTGDPLKMKSMLQVKKMVASEHRKKLKKLLLKMLNKLQKLKKRLKLSQLMKAHKR